MYELDIKDELCLGLDIFKEVLNRNTRDASESQVDQKFVTELGSMIHERLATVDEIIKKAAPEWPIEKINVIDRNVLRLGLTELLFGDKINVPPKVAIDESIELAKEFGGETTGKFVNGVLGAVYRELGEPGKDSISKPQVKTSNKAGAFVYAEHEGKVYAAMILDIFGYWTMARGAVSENELAEEAAIREVKEELGLGNLEIRDKLGEYVYVSHNPDEGKVNNNIQYFIAKTNYSPIVLEKSDGIVEGKWFAIEDLKDLKIYKDMRSLIDIAIGKLEV